MLQEISVKCEDLLERCIMFGDTINCADIFSSRITYMGGCCTYNYQRPTVEHMSQLYREKLPYPDGKHLFYSGSGPFHSLIVVLKDDLDDYTYRIHSCVLFKVIIFSPKNFPDIQTASSTEVLIKPHQEVNINIVPTIVISDSKMRNFSPNSRKCYFNDEGNLSIRGSYSMSECLLNCRINLFLKSCGCVPPNTSNIVNATNCMLSDIPCLARLHIKFETNDPFNLNDDDDVKMSVQCKHCLSRCSYIRYNAPHSWVHIGQPANGEFYKHGILKNIKYRELLSVVHIFFRENTFRLMQQSVTQNWDDLLNNLGGICSFMFGGSIISIIELIYFVTGRYFVMYYRRKKQLNKRKSINESLIGKNSAAVYSNSNSKIFKRNKFERIQKEFEYELYWNEFIKPPLKI